MAFKDGKRKYKLIYKFLSIFTVSPGLEEIKRRLDNLEAKLNLVLSKIDLYFSTETANKECYIVFPLPLMEVAQIPIFDEYLTKNKQIYNQLVSCNFKNFN